MTEEAISSRSNSTPRPAANDLTKARQRVEFWQGEQRPIGGVVGDLIGDKALKEYHQQQAEVNAQRLDKLESELEEAAADRVSQKALVPPSKITFASMRRVLIGDKLLVLTEKEVKAEMQREPEPDVELPEREPAPTETADRQTAGEQVPSRAITPERRAELEQNYPFLRKLNVVSTDTLQNAPYPHAISSEDLSTYRELVDMINAAFDQGTPYSATPTERQLLNRVGKTWDDFVKRRPQEAGEPTRQALSDRSQVEAASPSSGSEAGEAVVEGAGGVRLTRTARNEITEDGGEVDIPVLHITVPQGRGRIEQLDLDINPERLGLYRDSEGRLTITQPDIALRMMRLPEEIEQSIIESIETAVSRGLIEDPPRQRTAQRVAPEVVRPTHLDNPDLVEDALEEQFPPREYFTPLPERIRHRLGNTLDDLRYHTQRNFYNARRLGHRIKDIIQSEKQRALMQLNPTERADVQPGSDEEGIHEEYVKIFSPPDQTGAGAEPSAKPVEAAAAEAPTSLTGEQYSEPFKQVLQNVENLNNPELRMDCSVGEKAFLKMLSMAKNALTYQPDKVKLKLDELEKIPNEAELTNSQQETLTIVVESLKHFWLIILQKDEEKFNTDIESNPWLIEQIRNCHGMEMSPLLQLTNDPKMKRTIATLLAVATEMVAEMPASLSAEAPHLTHKGQSELDTIERQGKLNDTQTTGETKPSSADSADISPESDHKPDDLQKNLSPEPPHFVLFHQNTASISRPRPDGIEIYDRPDTFDPEHTIMFTELPDYVFFNPSGELVFLPKMNELLSSNSPEVQEHIRKKLETWLKQMKRTDPIEAQELLPRITRKEETS